MIERILAKVGMKAKKKDLKEWKKFVDEIDKIETNPKNEVNIGIVGKYQKIGDYNLPDSYISVIQAIKHAAWHLGKKAKIVWINSEDIEEGSKPKDLFKDIKGIIVPGGFGDRGVEGMITAIKYVRENKIPYLGLCFGMQLATVEYCRSILNEQDANTTEVNPQSKCPVIHLMPDQEKKMLDRDYGATMRLGSWTCQVKKGTLAENLYKKYHWLGKNNLIKERHRHRFEFNNLYRNDLEKGGLIVSGTTPDNLLVEIIELPQTVHPFFVGVQFHPEFKSRFLKPHPLFLGLLENASKNI